jgi:HEAT repeat protein
MGSIGKENAMRHTFLVSLCFLLPVAYGWPSESSSLRAAPTGAPVAGSPESPAGRVSAEIPADVKTAMEMLQSPDRNTQADGMMKLRYMKGSAEAALPLLIGMLGSDDRFPVMKLIASSLSSKTQSCSSEPTFGGEAAETLAWIGKTSDELLGRLKDRRWQVRANAVRAVGGIKDARAIDPLTSFLSDKREHPVVRGNAALALALMGDVSAVDTLIPLLKDKDPRVRAAAAAALGRLHDPRALQPLIATLGDEDAGVRRAVVGGLGGIGGPVVFDPLVLALKDPDRQVREVAAAALGRVPDARAVEPLLAALSDSYGNVRINAAIALGKLKEPRALEPVIRMLNDSSEGVRGAAAEALGQMDDSRAVPPLTVMASREEREIPLARALQALTALGHTGAKEAYDRYRVLRPNWKQWWAQNKDELLRRK